LGIVLVMMREFAVANALALIVALAWLALLMLPAERAVRVRNAFLMRRGRREHFNWTPTETPQGFRQERRKAPGVIEEAVSAAGVRDEDNDWQRALRLVEMLVRHARYEGGIRADLATTFEGIVAGHGYCADYVRVYLAAAVEVGLFCRQWAFSFDGFGGHGHTFVEVYDRQRAAWAFLDVHNNVYAVLAGTAAPVDALALHDALLGAPESIEFRQAAPGRLGFPHFEKLLDYYRRGAEHWYLWWGNDVVTREQGGMARGLRLISGRLSHLAGSILGSLPPLVVLATPENEAAIARMEGLRRRVLGVAVLCVVLFVSLVGQLGWQLLDRRHA
jgi:hypothetical protein